MTGVVIWSKLKIFIPKVIWRITPTLRSLKTAPLYLLRSRGLFVWEQLVKPSHYSRLPKTIFPCSNLCCESWYCKIISTKISFSDCYEHLMPSDRSYRKHSKEHNHMLANDVLRAEVSTLKNEEPWFYITNFTIWLASVIDTSLSGIGKCPTNVFYWTRSLRQVRTRLIIPR